jgi:hypothetical protein
LAYKKKRRERRWKNKGTKRWKNRKAQRLKREMPKSSKERNLRRWRKSWKESKRKKPLPLLKDRECA